MTLPSFLRWGGRREGRGQPVLSRPERRSEARWALEGRVWIYWVDEAGEADRTEGDLVDVTESLSGFGAEVRRPVPLGPGVWVVGDIAKLVPGDLGMTLDKALEVEPDLRRAYEADGQTRIAPAVVRNAEDGRLEVNTAARVPTATLALLEGREAGCLCLVRSCEAYGDRFLLEVEAVSEAGPVSVDRRAA